MYRLWVENEKKEKIELTNNVAYEVIDIDGVLPAKAVINDTATANNDGSEFNSSRIEKRPISITILPRFPVEENRQKLYKYFKAKRITKIFFKNKNRDVVIDAHIENIDGSLFEQTQKLIINGICLKPYFKDTKEITKDLSKVIDMFEFPFSIEKEGMELSIVDKYLEMNALNEGDTEAGLIIEITASGEVVKPVLYNATKRESFGINMTLKAGDIITINTNKGSKKIELLRAGETINIINNIMKNPVWFALDIGDNVFTYACDSGSEFINIKFSFANLYEGV